MELAYELHSNGYDAAILAEIWVDDNKVNSLNISGYHKILAPRPTEIGGGVGIYLRDYYNYQKLKLTSTNNFEVVGINITSLQLHIISVYINPRITIENLKSGLKNLVTETRNIHKLIIGGDFNAHNTIWGCDSNNNRGNIVFDTMITSDLLILNNGTYQFGTQTKCN